MTNAVYVKFIQSSFVNYNNKEYAFLCDIEDVEVDDYILVDTARGYQVAVVTRIAEEDKQANKWVVCRLTDILYNFEDKMAKLAKKSIIMERIKARYEKITGIEIYRKASKLDNELKILFDEYDKLDK